MRWGVVFRSGELSQLSDADVGRLGELGIQTVIDLRSPEEVRARGEARLPPGAELHAVPIASSDMFSKLIPMFLEGDFSRVPPNLLDDVNRHLVRGYTAQFGALLRTLLEPGRRPLVFNCTQGKDRTGFGAAMVLSALGVPWETVVEDYLLSNHYRRAENDKLLGMVRGLASGRSDPEAEEIAVRRVQGLLYVEERSLQAAHAEIVTRHGSVDGYLVDALGCTVEGLERLRD